MKTSGKIFLGTLFFIIVASIIATAYFGTPKETYEFEEFSVDSSWGSAFENYDVSSEPTVKEMHRSLKDDLTITSFDKTYIEKEYYRQNGEKINYTQSLIDHLKEDKTNNVTEISGNLTSCIRTADDDTDASFIYHDDDHLIMIEGGDAKFIKEVAQSIKILD